MAVMAIATESATREDWITPEEQLLRLALPSVRGGVHMPDPLEQLVPKIEESMARIIIDHFQLQSLNKYRIPSLFDLAVKELVGPLPSLPTTKTNWYTALSRINMVPKKIPPLPLNICEILSSPCPIRENSSVSDTHLLYLIPPGTPNQLAFSVGANAEGHLAENNPFKFQYFPDETSSEYGDALFGEPQWVLMTQDMLPGSCYSPYTKQAQIVEELKVKAFANYEIPLLREAVGATFLHKVATGESILPAGDKENGHLYTYTRVQETAVGHHFAVGSFDSDGLRVFISAFDNTGIGITAVRKFS